MTYIAEYNYTLEGVTLNGQSLTVEVGVLLDPDYPRDEYRVITVLCNGIEIDID